MTQFPSQASTGSPWHVSGDRLVVPRAPSGMDRLRLGVAVVLTAAAGAFFGLGLMNPAAVGFAGRVTLLWMTGPALVLAAAIHLALIYSGIRRPHLAVSPRRVEVQGFVLRPEQIVRVWIDRTPAMPEPSLMLATTDPALPVIAVLPPGALPESELRTLAGLIEQRLNQEPRTKN